MTRIQIQLPEPLFRRLTKIASAQDWSLAELIRRGMEIYARSCPEATERRRKWRMPVLRKSGGHLADPAQNGGAIPKPDIMAQLREVWGERVFSMKEVRAMRAAELKGEAG